MSFRIRPPTAALAAVAVLVSCLTATDARAQCAKGGNQMPRGPQLTQMQGQRLPPQLFQQQLIQQQLIQQQLLQQQLIQQQQLLVLRQLQPPPQQQLVGQVPPQQPLAGQPLQPQQVRVVIQRDPQLLLLVQQHPPLLNLLQQKPELVWMLQQEMALQKEIGQSFGTAQLQDFLSRYQKQNPQAGNVAQLIVP